MQDNTEMSLTHLLANVFPFLQLNSDVGVWKFKDIHNSFFFFFNIFRQGTKSWSRASPEWDKWQEKRKNRNNNKNIQVCSVRDKLRRVKRVERVCPCRGRIDIFPRSARALFWKCLSSLASEGCQGECSKEWLRLEKRTSVISTICIDWGRAVKASGFVAQKVLMKTAAGTQTVAAKALW